MKRAALLIREMTMNSTSPSAMARLAAGPAAVGPNNRGGNGVITTSLTRREWIKGVKDRPFFAYIATNAPHGPFHCPEKYRRMYGGNGFYGMITNIDDNMGRLMRKLEEWGLSGNALLVFMTSMASFSAP